MKDMLVIENIMPFKIGWEPIWQKEEKLSA
jgi:hypothetical protein